MNEAGEVDNTDWPRTEDIRQYARPHSISMPVLSPRLSDSTSPNLSPMPLLSISPLEPNMGPECQARRYARVRAVPETQTFGVDPWIVTL